MDIFIAAISVLLGLTLILVVLWDAFETIIFPRRVTRKMRLTRLFYRYTWLFWSMVVRKVSSGKKMEHYLSFYGPSSLIFLLSIWAVGMIFGFGMLHWAVGSAGDRLSRTGSFGMNLYLSGTTFFTLGLGDIVPRNPGGKFLTVVETGIGFGFLAMMVGYLPALNQSFARREVNISMLDARAGSPPTAAEMMIRHSHETGMEELRQLLHEWERWSAEFLESHLSYPVLAYFRSQHDNQSWLGSLTTMLDITALVQASMEEVCTHQAELTFAMARHAVVDLAIIFNITPRDPGIDRLPRETLNRLCTVLTENGFHFQDGAETEARLKELRRMYEPYVCSLADYLCISIPPIISESMTPDNWQTSAWESRPLISGPHHGGHF
jgi:hypothetical protein